MKVLVIGAAGMLGVDVVSVLKNNGHQVFTTSRDGAAETLRLEITSLAEVSQIVSEVRPDWVVNCAAYTSVDVAEEEEQTAYMVNAIGVGHLAYAAREIGSKMLQVSTDYVFASTSPSSSLVSSASRELPKLFSHNEELGDVFAGHTEESVCCPTSVYGLSKWYGEQIVSSVLPNNALIVRTSWLHGLSGHNFVDTMLRVGKEREELRVVADQFGSPTWTPWLAKVLVSLVEADTVGLYHVSSRGNVSWYEFAQGIFEESGTEVRVLPQSTSDCGRKAARPSQSTLGLEKIESFLNEPCISWHEGVRAHLAARRNGN